MAPRVCAPSRATLFSGRNSGNLAGLPGGSHSLAELLRRGGYETVAFGKSAPMDELGSSGKMTPLTWGLPSEHGFEVFAGQPNQKYCHNMYPTEWRVGDAVEPLPLNTNKPKSRHLCMRSPSEYNYTTDLFADAAIAWLHARPRSGGAGLAARPFFAYLSFTVPHAGGWSSYPKASEDGQPVPNDMGYAVKAHSDWPLVELDHAASVSYLDMKVGAVLDALEYTGHAPNTAVFFASDNGPHNEGGHDVTFFGSQGGLRGFKRSYYEGGVRSPSLVRWPGHTPAGSVSHVPWAFWDVLPTMLEMAGLEAPADASLDGRSIVRALKGGDMPPHTSPMFWTWRAPADDADDERRRGYVLGAGARSGYAARLGDWKVVVLECADGRRLVPSMADKMQLYNLSADPAEERDVAAMGTGPEVVRQMKTMIVQQNYSCQCYQC